MASLTELSPDLGTPPQIPPPLKGPGDEEGAESLENVPPGETGEPQEGENTATVQTSSEVVEAVDASCVGPRALAETMDSLIDAGFDDEARKQRILSVLENNPTLFKEGLVKEKIASDIIEIENNQISPFVAQLNEAAQTDADITPFIPRQVNSVREALYGIVLNGQFSAAKINEFLPGGIIYKGTPSDEYTAEALEASRAFAACGQNEQGQQLIYVYKNSLYIDHPKDTGIERDQSHLIRHEFGHVLEFSTMWGPEKYEAFLKAADSLDENVIASIRAENPELGQVLDLLKDPSLALITGNDYIAGLCTELRGLAPEQIKQVGQLRQTIARELVAEMIGYFLESGRSEETFLMHRLANSQLMRSGSEKITMSVILEYMQNDPRMAPILDINKTWFNKLSQNLNGSSEQILIYPTEPGSDYRRFIADSQPGFIEMIEPSIGNSSQTSENQPGQGGNKDPLLLTIWEKMVGNE